MAKLKATSVTGDLTVTGKVTSTVAGATTSTIGTVKLNSATNSTSTSEAATPSAVKAAYDLANGKANSSHGNHVPATQTADNKKFLRNDNTWQVVTPANIGAADRSHGNHVPTTQSANNAVYLRNDNTWQTITPDKIGAAASGHAHQGSIVSIIDLGTRDLNTVTATGFYKQDANANTSSARNYPENSAGSLMVTTGAGTQQRYHVYNSSRVYTRSIYGSGSWTAWAREYNTLNKPTASEVGAAASSHSHSNATSSAHGFMSNTDKGKLDGIATGANNYVHPNDANTRHVTDSEKGNWNGKLNASEVATTGANKVLRLDGSGDANARLFKSTYANQSTISGAIAFRTNNSSDSYIRFCSDTGAIRNWLGVATSSHNHNSNYIQRTGTDTISTNIATTGYLMCSDLRLGRQTDATGALLQSSENSVTLMRSKSGYVQIGPKNGSYCHYHTDRAKHHFNKDVEIEGTLDVKGNLYAGGDWITRGLKNLYSFQNEWTYMVVHTDHPVVRGVSWYESDFKLKREITCLNPNSKFSVPKERVSKTRNIRQVNGLETIKKIEHYQFIKNGVIDKVEDQYVECGYLAQQLEDINKDFVFKVEQNPTYFTSATDKDGRQIRKEVPNPIYDEKDPVIRNPQPSAIMPYITKAIQELSEENQILKDRLSAIEAKLGL